MLISADTSRRASEWLMAATVVSYRSRIVHADSDNENKLISLILLLLLLFECVILPLNKSHIDYRPVPSRHLRPVPFSPAPLAHSVQCLRQLQPGREWVYLRITRVEWMYGIIRVKEERSKVILTSYKSAVKMKVAEWLSWTESSWVELN